VAAIKFYKTHEQITDFLSSFEFELYQVPEIIDSSLIPQIRDTSDQPVLFSALGANVDILITGDKDFLSLQIKDFAILTPSEFIDAYSN
jgi:predicted nucleic acid-binding protein